MGLVGAGLDRVARRRCSGKRGGLHRLSKEIVDDGNVRGRSGLVVTCHRVSQQRRLQPRPENSSGADDRTPKRVAALAIRRHEPAGTQTLADSINLANSPKYVGVKHFFRYIRPDAARVTANVSGPATLNASAYVHDAEKTLVIVLVNSASTAQPATIPVPVFPAGLSSFATYTSHDGSYFQAGTVSASGGSISVSVPAYGVMTLRSFGTGGGDSFASWIANYYAGAPNNSTTANPSGDGVSNLLKFAFNLPPNQPDFSVMTAGTGGRGPAADPGGRHRRPALHHRIPPAKGRRRDLSRAIVRRPSGVGPGGRRPGWIPHPHRQRLGARKGAAKPADRR